MNVSNLMSATGDEITIRQIEAADLEAVTRIIGNAERELFQHHDYSYLMMFRLFPTLCLVAQQKGETIGFTLGCSGGVNQEVFFLWQFAVTGDLRGMGIGSRLIRQSIANAKGLGCNRLECTITSKESKRAFERVASTLGSALEKIGEVRFRDPKTQEWTTEPLYCMQLPDM